MTATSEPGSDAPRWHQSPAVFVLLSAALIVCWSSGFLGIRFTNEEAPVFLVLFWRCLISGLLLLPFALTLGPPMTRAVVREQAMFGLLAMFLYLGGFAMAIGLRVPTGLVALMSDLVPLSIAILSLPMLGQRLSGRQWLGTGIAMAGVIYASADALRIGDAPAFAYALPILGMLSFGFAIVLQKRRALTQIPIVQSLCLQCLSAAAMFGPVALISGGIVPPLTPRFAFGMAWLVVLATFGSWALYYYCLRIYSAVRISSVIYLSPPVTMLWAWVLFDEPLTAAMFAGLAITLVGVWLVTSAGEAGGH